MARRTYIPTIVTTMKAVCSMLATARPFIVRLYPTNVVLLAALDTADSACQLLYDEALQEREFGD